MYRTPNNTDADHARAPHEGRPWTPSAAPEELPNVLFVAELLSRRLPHLARAGFAGSVSPTALAELGEPVLVRAEPKGDEVEAFVRLHDGGEPAFIDVSYGQVTVEIGARTREAADAAARSLRARFAEEPDRPAGRISVAFWMNSPRGGDLRHREIDTPPFADIADNYEAGVRAQLERLMSERAPESGRLILWRGAPGTGKSHALRALARTWSDWCSTHFVMDPEELFGRGGGYMLDLLTWDDGDEDRWRLVALEDAGELIAADARAVAGQSLSRLLNVTDGILGQGTRTLVLITTNEPVGRLHPATRRPGRCLADIEFKPLAVAEANAWLAARGQERRVTAPTPLAELFGDATEEADAGARPRDERFGFARVM